MADDVGVEAAQLGRHAAERGAVDLARAGEGRVARRRLHVGTQLRGSLQSQAGLRSMCEALNPWCHIASWVETERAQSRAHRSQQHGSGLVCPVPAPQSNLTLLSTRRRWTTTIKSGKTGVVIAAR